MDWLNRWVSRMDGLNGWVSRMDGLNGCVESMGRMDGLNGRTDRRYCCKYHCAYNNMQLYL